MSMSSSILIFMSAYFIGAIPIGYWLSRWAGIQDIRRYGSGNSGATNVGRALGLKYFFVVLAVDCLKAYFYLTFLVDVAVSPFVITISAFLLLAGNSYSLFLNGSGGKGVATAMGILLSLQPLLLVVLFIHWLLILSYIKDVGIASVLTAGALPLYALFLGMHGFVLIMGISLWVVWRHRINIRTYYTVR